MLSFLTQNIKQQRMTVDTFCTDVSISRQKFYRFVKEPWRFTPQTLDAISKTLKLSEPAHRKLFSYAGHNSDSFSINDLPSAPIESSFSDALNSKIEDLLSSEVYINRENIQEFEYYGSDSNISKLSALSIAQNIINSIDMSDIMPSEHSLSIHHNFTITIYNCVMMDDCIEDSTSEGQSLESPVNSCILLADLFQALDTAVHKQNIQNNCNDSSHIRISHFISEAPSDIASSSSKSLNRNLYLLKTLLPLLSTCGDYSYMTDKLRHPVWTDQNNFCVIKYSQLVLHDGQTAQEAHNDVNRLQKHSYFLIHFSPEGLAYVCPLGGDYADYLYHFFTLDTRGLIRGYNTYGNVVDINRQAYEMYANYDSILLHNDLCFDNISPEIWKNYFYDKLDSSPNFADFFCQVFTLNSHYSTNDISSLFFQNIFPYLNSRFEANQKTNGIVVTSEFGLRNFARRRIISDLLTSDSTINQEIAFSTEQMKDIFSHIIRSILDCQAGKNGVQRFYIARSNIFNRGYSYVFFRNYGLWSYNVNSKYRNVSMPIFKNADVANAIYNYINSLILARSSDYSSIIMSDDEAISFLSSLIDNLN